MAFTRFRPTSHFIAPHSWSNDPCGAVYIPETKEYIICYQWNPGTTEGGNCAWGMARSKDLMVWEDCAPAIQNGDTYDTLGVFSGSIVSTLVGDERVLLLFYTSVSALPIHWSKPYIMGCESQSVAISKDYGRSWNRHLGNPLLAMPPEGENTTGWRDPFVSQWSRLSTLLAVDQRTYYMMIASGERCRGPQLQLYTSDNLYEWRHLSVLLEVKGGQKISDDSYLGFGKNFECASFFSLGDTDYIIVGVEEDEGSYRHNCHYTVWLSGLLTVSNDTPRFDIYGHGLLDHGISYAPHIFRDSNGRLLQLGWADEAAHQDTVRRQRWAGCLTHPRELASITRPLDKTIATKYADWTADENAGTMTTLGIRPAPQLQALRPQTSSLTLSDFNRIHSSNYEVQAVFSGLSGSERFTFNVRESSGSLEVTRLIFDLGNSHITVDRSQSSLMSLGKESPDTGHFQLLPDEDLHIRFFVDNSIIEVFANDRFALTSRIYPSLDTSVSASYHFGNYDTANVRFQYWEGLREAWPSRRGIGNAFEQDQSLTGRTMKSPEDQLPIEEIKS